MKIAAGQEANGSLLQLQGLEGSSESTQSKASKKAPWHCEIRNGHEVRLAVEKLNEKVVRNCHCKYYVTFEIASVVSGIKGTGPGR